MKCRVLLVVLSFATVAAQAQLDPLRNVSGTTPNPGESPWVTSSSGGWTVFHGFDAHATHVGESGPDNPRSDTFSTNWFAAGVEKNFGTRGFVLARGRVSLEPYTVPEEGYPELLQYVSAEGGGPTVGRMRAHDFWGEAAVQLGFRPSASTLLSVYAAAVGDPALGAAPAELRMSGVDFANAPFAYDLQETTHDSTRVVTAGFGTRWLTLEASVFHDAVTSGRHTSIEDGDIDSQSARVTLTPSPNVALQVSRGQLGDANERTVTSASITYGVPKVAVTALWTRREQKDSLSALAPQTAYSVELALRGTRNTFLARAEWVDRPSGFPVIVNDLAVERTTHATAGYIFDLVARPTFRFGVGVNADYHTQSHELPAEYGHKPQSVYAFVRVRSGRL
ncbi:MAG: hypothetical protein JO197_11900 [Acidobacteria bacterium]|nr:hypothetical protein [Acidobacteriota bacterium]MBV9476180.1 hypothetical protein [Acidobacteriota bacterium]